MENVYQSFEQMLAQVVGEYSHVIPGVADTVEILRAQGMRIGSTTGYTSEMMQYVLPVAQAEGYAPDSVVTPDITGGGRPSPFMLYECMRRENIYPASRVVKVGDTAVDMQEGKNAGAWAVGVLVGSNLMGMSQQEFTRATDADIRAKKEAATANYLQAGADLVINSIEDLPAAIEQINARMAAQGAAAQ